MSQDADQLEGFEELLEAFGRTLISGTEQFRGLVKTLNPETEAFDLTPTDDDSVSISALRSEIPATVVRPGASLTDSDGFSYRVTRIRRSPNQQVVRVECAVLNP